MHYSIIVAPEGFAMRIPTFGGHEGPDSAPGRLLGRHQDQTVQAFRPRRNLDLNVAIRGADQKAGRASDRPLHQDLQRRPKRLSQ